MYIDSITFKCECGKKFKYSIDDNLNIDCKCGYGYDIHIERNTVLINDKLMVAINEELFDKDVFKNFAKGYY